MIARSTLIGPDARALLEEHDLVDLDPDRARRHLADRDTALAILTRESDSVSRLAWGFLAWSLTVVGLIGFAAAVWAGASWWVHALGTALAAGTITTGALMGYDVWQAGREVVTAFCRWTLLPEHLAGGGTGVRNWRADPVRDAIEARTFIYQGRRVLRLVVAVAAFLAGPEFGHTIELAPDRDAWWRDQPASVTVFVLGLIITSCIAGSIVFGGQQRQLSAHSQRDPIQRRIFRRDR